MGLGSENILEIKNVEVAYNKVILALTRCYIKCT